jgi:hypothetical protein
MTVKLLGWWFILWWWRYLRRWRYDGVTYCESGVMVILLLVLLMISQALWFAVMVVLLKRWYAIGHNSGVTMMFQAAVLVLQMSMLILCWCYWSMVVMVWWGCYWELWWCRWCGGGVTESHDGVIVWVLLKLWWCWWCGGGVTESYGGVDGVVGVLLRVMMV